AVRTAILRSLALPAQCEIMARAPRLKQRLRGSPHPLNSGLARAAKTACLTVPVNLQVVADEVIERRHRRGVAPPPATRRPSKCHLWVLCHEATPVQTAMRNCTRDEGRPLEFGNQVLISSHRKLLWSKAMLVNVAEKSGHDPVRHGWERRAQANRQ